MALQSHEEEKNASVFFDPGWLFRAMRRRLMRVVRPEAGEDHQVFDRTPQRSSTPNNASVPKRERPSGLPDTNGSPEIQMSAFSRREEGEKRARFFDKINRVFPESR
jgi:hypothetical protein